jgi:predicted PurR-regulated permease PerM
MASAGRFRRGEESVDKQIEPRQTSRPWGALTKQIVVVGLIVAAVWVLYRVSYIIPSVIMGVLLAYILTPVVNWLHRRIRVSRTVVLIFVYLVLLLFLGLIPSLVIPSMVNQFSGLNVDLQGITDSIRSLFSAPVQVMGISIELSQYYSEIVSAIQSLLSPFASGAVGVVFSLFSSVLWLVFILVV